MNDQNQPEEQKELNEEIIASADPSVASLVAVNGTIVSTEGFNSCNSCVCFYIENKIKTTGDESDDQSFFGTTNKCWTNSGDISYFSSPFQAVLKVNGIADRRPLRPILYIKVLSFDYQNFLTSESFGFVELPTTRGKHSLTVHTLKPFIRSRTEMMNNYFMGSASLRSAEEQPDLKYANNYGIECESSGRVVVELDIITQTEKVGPNVWTKRDKYKAMNASVDSIKQNVLSVVLAFQRARRRMQTLKGQFDESLFL